MSLVHSSTRVRHTLHFTVSTAGKVTIYKMHGCCTAKRHALQNIVSIMKLDYMFYTNQIKKYPQLHTSPLNSKANVRSRLLGWYSSNSPISAKARFPPTIDCHCFLDMMSSFYILQEKHYLFTLPHSKLLHNGKRMNLPYFHRRHRMQDWSPLDAKLQVGL